MRRTRGRSSVYASEADLPPKRPLTSKSTRYTQSEVEPDATTDADLLTENTPPTKARRGPGRPKKAASSRTLSPEDELGGAEAQPAPTRGKKAKSAATTAKSGVADSESDAPKPKATRGKAKAKLTVIAVSDDDISEAPAPKRPARTPAAARGSRVPKSDSSSDELLLPASRTGTDAGTGSESERKTRRTSQAPSRARATPATTARTPAASKAKKGRSTRASSRASSSVASGDEAGDDSAIDSSQDVGRSRGRKTVTARDVPAAELSSSVRRSARTPGRATLKGRGAPPEAETDIDNLLSAAAARAAARHASMSDAEGRAASSRAPSASLGRSTRGRTPSVAASDRESETDLVVPKPALVGKAKTSSKASKQASTKHNTTSYDSDPHASLSVPVSAASSVSDSGEDLNDVTPQPKKTSSSNHASSGSSRPIPPPNFSQDLSASTLAAAPSERTVVNGWRELAKQSKTPGGSLNASTVLSGLKSSGSGSAAEQQQLPRIIAPLRKSKGGPTSPSTSARTAAGRVPVHTPKVKMEEDDSIVIMSPPPRPLRSPERERTRGQDATFTDTSNYGSRQLHPHDGEGTPRAAPASPSKIPTPKARSKQAPTSNNMDVDPMPVPPLPAPALSARAPTSRSAVKVSTSIDMEPHKIKARALVPSLSATTIGSSSSHEGLPPIHPTSSIPLNPDALDALHSVSPFIVSSSSTLPNSTSGGLTEEQLNSTLEEFIRAETQKKYAEMQAEGERILRELREEGERNRALIIDHLRLAPTTASSNF